MRRIAILDTSGTALGSYDALRVATAVHTAFGVDAQIVLGAMADSPGEAQLLRLDGPWKELRRMRVEYLDADAGKKVFGFGPDIGPVSRPIDGGLDFRDCDFWIVVGPGFERRLAPLAPYAVVLTMPANWLRREADFERVLGLRRTLQNARGIWVPTAFELGHWRLLTDAPRGKFFIGAPPACALPHSRLDIPPTEDTSPYLMVLASELDFKLLRMPLADTWRSDCLVPFASEGRAMPGQRLAWGAAKGIAPSLEAAVAMARSARGIVLGPTSDPNDVRIQLARTAGTRIAMLWAEHLGPMPAWTQAIALICPESAGIWDDLALGALTAAPAATAGSVPVAEIRALGER